MPLISCKSSQKATPPGGSATARSADDRAVRGFHQSEKVLPPGRDDLDHPPQVLRAIASWLDILRDASKPGNPRGWDISNLFRQLRLDGRLSDKAIAAIWNGLEPDERDRLSTATGVNS